MTVRKLVASPRSGAVLLIVAVFVLAGCTSDSSESDESNSPTPATSPDGAPQQSDDDQAAAIPRLGFAAAVYEIPPPAGVAENSPPFTDAVSLIDAGVEAGIWTEVDGIRAVLSIVLGELSPQAVPALDELPHTSYPSILNRARVLLEDQSLDEAVRADLERLTYFFFSDSFSGSASGDDEAGASSIGAGQEPAVLAASASSQPTGVFASLPASVSQSLDCGIDEFLTFGAQDTQLCYQVMSNSADDIVYVPATPGAIDPSAQIFDLIEQARTGYEELAGSELPAIRVLLSTRLNLGDTGTEKTLAHVASYLFSTCRIAIFATDEFFTGGPELRLMVAHELFHCVQETWNGDLDNEGLVAEGGAHYFAQKLVNECTGIDEGFGRQLDTNTASGSLLDLSYEGWFFWAFLDEQGYLAPQAIAQLHRAVAEGTSVSDGLSALVADLPSVLNEFYVRLMGPGLACDFQGKEVTETIPITQKGPVELEASLWQGTRYKLDYTKKRLFEQENKGPGRVGMAKFASRSAEDDWVVTTPEVRTKCTEDEPWIVVVTALNDSETAPPQVLEVTKMSNGVCDACLIGQWGIDPASVNAVFAKNVPGQSLDVTGSWILGFAAAVDGASSATFTDERNLQMTAGPIEIKSVGSGTGAYRADETNIVVDGYTSTVVASALGVTSVPFKFAGDGENVAYTCEKDSLTYTIGEDSWAATRIPETPKGEPYFG